MAAAVAQEVPGKPSESRLEPWADPALKVMNGLVLWLDADRPHAARRVHGQPELSDGTRVETWYDASGHGWDLSQSREGARPTYLQRALRFDGEATYLERSGLAERLRGFTLFVVAAPLSNGGGFRAFAAMHQDRQPDFTSAYTLDLGPGFTGRFESLNVEGNGFGGAGNLMADASEFGVVRRMTITSAPGSGGTKLWVDGKPGRSRDRGESELIADRILVGCARFCRVPARRRASKGDILQILLYDRVLDQAERREVEGYLASRPGEGSIVRAARPGIGKPLVAAKDPPPVQMLVPGFSARELPVDLKNINNVRYRPDGRLVVLGYDGNIHLLSDRDGDGLEETVETFWENKGDLVAPIGMALTPTGYERGEGVFVASKGKVSLIVDTDRDGKADREIIVARGWRELPHGVDALGVAVDGQRNVYFGLGTTDFTNAYVLDKGGRAAYRLGDEHGTIQKVSPDFGRRDHRHGRSFPVGLLFTARRPVRHRSVVATWRHRHLLDEVVHNTRPQRWHYDALAAVRKNSSVVDEWRASSTGAAAPIDVRAVLQRAGRWRARVRAGPLARRRVGDGVLAGQAVPHRAGEDLGRLRRAESPDRGDDHAPG